MDTALEGLEKEARDAKKGLWVDPRAHPMPFTIRLYRRIPVRCSVTYNADHSRGTAPCGISLVPAGGFLAICHATRGNTFAHGQAHQLIGVKELERWPNNCGQITSRSTLMQTKCWFITEAMASFSNDSFSIT
jgi:hypothetical protein